MIFHDDERSAAAMADANAEKYGGDWVVHSVANEARTRLRYVAVNAVLAWRLPIHYRTGEGT